ncbi:anti-sigma factor [Stenotrophomonas rhizophila]|uniref:anti-sigma factor n=1 Tax=Stenotrophomonas rhizophila TaxID=216778 RepID=UPI003512F566
MAAHPYRAGLAGGRCRCAPRVAAHRVLAGHDRPGCRGRTGGGVQPRPAGTGGPGCPPVAVTPTPPPTPSEPEQATKPVTPLVHDDGTPGWLASVDKAQGKVLMVPVPAAADAAGRAPELWLIPAGGTPRSLGLVSINRAHTVTVPDALRDALVNGSVLAITLEPSSGAPQGIPTGPIIAKGDIATL